MFKLTLSQRQFPRNVRRYFRGVQCGCCYVPKWQSTWRFLRSLACLAYALRPFAIMSRSAFCRRRCARMVNVATTRAYFTGSRLCSARGRWDLLWTRYGSCFSGLNRVRLRPSAGTNFQKEKIAELRNRMKRLKMMETLLKRMEKCHCAALEECGEKMLQ